MVRTRYMAFLTAVIASLTMGSASAATYFVSTIGSDTGGDGSTAKTWRSIGFGITKMASGDTLIVKSGTYSDMANFIHSPNYNIPSGAPGKYTTIMAEQPGSVRIRNTGTLDYEDNMVQLASGTNYVKVDGFIFEMANTAYPPYIAEMNGNYNKLTRNIFKRSGVTDNYGGWVEIGGNDNLLEDCAGVGSARYGFKVGGASSSTQRNILRRCVGRVDYSSSDQPKATFSVYGNDNVASGVRDVLLQNCIAVDSRKGPTSGDVTYGGVLFPKNVIGSAIQGSIVLNVEAEYAGFFIKEQGAQNLRIMDSIAWGGYGGSSIAGVRANSSGPGYFTVDHMTVGGYSTGYYNKESASTRSLTNSVFVNNATLTSSSDAGWTSISNNGFFPASQLKGLLGVSLAGPDLKYIVRVEPGSALSGKGSDGADIGANVTKRYGKTGTLWGEAGYDQITTESLWPWLYEDKIKAVFSEPNTPPPGAVPASNDTTRGFAAGTDKFGKPMTLTRYVWQFLGNEIPAEIYGNVTATPVYAPLGLKAAVLP